MHQSDTVSREKADIPCEIERAFRRLKFCAGILDDHGYDKYRKTIYDSIDTLRKAVQPRVVNRDQIEAWIDQMRDKYAGKTIPSWWATVSGAEVASFLVQLGIEVEEEE